MARPGWPVDAAVFDGEAVAGDGQEGIQSVFGKRGRPGGAMALVACDVLQLDGVDVMDAAGLWDLWFAEERRRPYCAESIAPCKSVLSPIAIQGMSAWLEWPRRGDMR